MPPALPAQLSGVFSGITPGLKSAATHTPDISRPDSHYTQSCAIHHSDQSIEPAFVAQWKLMKGPTGYSGGGICLKLLSSCWGAPSLEGVEAMPSTFDGTSLSIPTWRVCLGIPGIGGPLDAGLVLWRNWR